MIMEESRYSLEVLTADHQILHFTCGDSELDGYLQEEALLDMENEVARTFVEIDRKEPATVSVAGFFTLRAHAVKIDEQFFEEWEELDEESDRNDNRTIEVPLVELMYLARDKRLRGMGIGDVLMIDALRKVASAGECIGFIGLHLRSTSAGMSLYERFDFRPFSEHPHYDGARLFLPIQVIREIVARS